MDPIYIHIQNNIIYILDPSIPHDQHFRFRDEGQMLTISNVTKADENIIYQCQIAVPPNPSIYLELMVHPSDWKEPTTSRTPMKQPEDGIKNLPSIGTDPSNAASANEEISFTKMIVIGLLALKLNLGYLCNVRN